MEILLFSLGLGMAIFIAINMRTLIIDMLSTKNIISKGIIWFVTLLLINIILIIFTVIWSNYIKRKLRRGKRGPEGYPGRKGYEGNTDIKCINNIK